MTILVLITFMPIPQVYGETPRGSGQIQSVMYTWSANGDFVVGSPIEISGDLTLMANSEVEVLEIVFDGCGVNEIHDLRSGPYSVYGNAFWIFRFDYRITPSSAGELKMIIQVAYNSSGGFISLTSYATGQYVAYSGRGPALGYAIVIFPVHSVPTPGQSSYDTLLSQYNSLQSQYSSLQSQYDSLNANYQGLQAGNSGLLLVTVVTGIVAVVGFVLYFTERGKPRLPLPP
jgi:hypothetical protein